MGAWLLRAIVIATWLATGAHAQIAFTVAEAIPESAGPLAFGFEALWAISERRLLRVDPLSGAVAEVELPASATGLALPELDAFRGIGIGEGAVWLPDLSSSAIHKVDPAQMAVVQSIETDVFGSGGSIGVGEGSIWVPIFEDRNKTLVRYSAADGAVLARIPLPEAAAGVLAAEGSVWVTAASRAELYRIDPVTNRVAETTDLAAPTALITAGYGAVWVSQQTGGLVQRIDPESGVALALIETGVSDMEPDGCPASAPMGRFEVIEQRRVSGSS